MWPLTDAGFTVPAQGRGGPHDRTLRSSPTPRARDLTELKQRREPGVNHAGVGCMPRVREIPPDQQAGPFQSAGGRRDEQYQQPNIPG